MAMAKIPGVASPCTNRHAMNDQSPVAVDASAVATASNHAEATITRFSPATSGNAPDHGCRDSHRQGRCCDRQRHRDVRRIEHTHQHGQQWLRGVEVEKGGEAREHDRKDGRTLGDTGRGTSKFRELANGDLVNEIW